MPVTLYMLIYDKQHVYFQVLLFIILPHINGEGGRRSIAITLSVCLMVSAQCLLNLSTISCKTCIVVYYHETVYHAEKKLFTIVNGTVTARVYQIKI